jgi:DNA-binding CsgD family transcriptional regulator
MISAEDLIRKLIECKPASNETAADSPQGTNAEQIVLDLDVDGSRYLLIRLPRDSELPVQLSPREREIVRLVALGHSNKIIADVLSISSWTVCTHLRRIFAKLGVSSRAAMVAHLSKIGITGVARRNGSTNPPDNRVPVRASARPINRGDTLREFAR